MAQQNPKIAALKIDDLIDARFVRKLDEAALSIGCMPRNAERALSTHFLGLNARLRLHA